MYLTIQNERYTVRRRTVKEDSITYYGIDREPVIGGIIEMYADNGFLLSSDNSDLFKRTVYNKGVILLTNDPEPVPHIPTPAENRENAYEGANIIPWHDSMITVDEANKLFTQYFAEGDVAKCEELTEKIKVAKAEIRKQFPD